MWQCYTLFCLFFCVTLTFGEAKDLGLKEGEVCKVEEGTEWICKKLEDCLETNRDNSMSSSVTSLCNSKGDTSLICCDSRKNDNSMIMNSMPVGSKSKLMCEKYAQYVFAKKSQGFDDEEEIFDTCAASEPLITNGVAAEPKEFPHMALIGYNFGDTIQWSCGGTLISERFVLSAGHCTTIPQLGPAKLVRLGEYNIFSDEDEYQAKSMATNYEIAETINYPEYNPPSVYNDISLYRLAKDVEFNEYIRPACLHTEYTVNKEYGIATGWGLTKPLKLQGTRSEVLMKVNLTITPIPECVDFYKNRSKKIMKEGIRNQSMVCAGDLPNRKDTCNGDSGGPLQLRLEKPYCMYSVFGVTSFGPADCGGGRRPAVYTRVSNYIDWIENIVWS